MTEEINPLTKTEALMYELHQKLITAITKEEKKELRKKLKTLEKQYNAAIDSNINGKTYPVKQVPPNISKEELLKLIDSVEVDPRDEKWQFEFGAITQTDTIGLDL